MNMPADPGNLLLTPEQRADDALPDPVMEALAVRLYESDWESYYNDDDEVQWRDNYADRDRYRALAQAAVNFLVGADRRQLDYAPLDGVESAWGPPPGPDPWAMPGPVPPPPF